MPAKMQGLKRIGRKIAESRIIRTARKAAVGTRNIYRSALIRKLKNSEMRKIREEKGIPEFASKARYIEGKGYLIETKGIGFLAFSRFPRPKGVLKPLNGKIKFREDGTREKAVLRVEYIKGGYNLFQIDYAVNGKLQRVKPFEGSAINVDSFLLGTENTAKMPVKA